MTDMNRRNLLAMLGSVPLIGGPVIRAKPMSDLRSSKFNQAVAPPVIRKWRLSPHLTTNENVRLIFAGLMVFCYNDNTEECEIAFYGNPGHRLRILVIRNCKESLPVPPMPTTDGVFEIGIAGKLPDVSFYYAGSPDKFDRNNGKLEDFRWLLDLEGEDFHKIELPKEPKLFNATFKTKLRVKHGTFYTAQRTNSKFKVRGGTYNGQPKGRIARLIGSRLQIAGSECLSLKFNEQPFLPFPICSAGGTSYEIHFRNECTNTPGHPCGHGDFRKIFDGLQNVPGGPHDLEVDGQPGSNTSPAGLCYVNVEGTDAAPCMGAGFGQTGGFPS